MDEHAAFSPAFHEARGLHQPWEPPAVAQVHPRFCPTSAILRDDRQQAVHGLKQAYETVSKIFR